MDQITKDLLTAAKHLASAVELIDDHHPQRNGNDDDCEVCVALFEVHEAIAKAEKQS